MSNPNPKRPTKDQQLKGAKKGGKTKAKILRKDWAKFLVEDKVLRMGGPGKVADWLEKNHPEALVGMIGKFLPQQIVLGSDPDNPLIIELPAALKDVIGSLRKDK